MNAELVSRSDLVGRIMQPIVWDVVVIGGGATGLGIALDAAARGHSVVLVEQGDFAKGTSSKATKLLHGGVRYLAQGKIKLVREALMERSIVLRNAPHLCAPLPFVVPVYSSWEKFYYGAGLKVYELLAAKHSLGRTEVLSPSETIGALPGLSKVGLRGGIRYWDAQFDDARLALSIAMKASYLGALLMNYCRAVTLVRDKGRVSGVVCSDVETGGRYALAGRCVINASGVWVDELRSQDARMSGLPMMRMVSPSQGVHLVVSRDFLPGEQALMIPKTEDGRVLFCIPWLGKLIIGTTDTEAQRLDLDPVPTEQEIDFLIREANKYLERAVTRADIDSVWVGLRPLVSSDVSTESKSLSREHTIEISKSGLVTVTGGKWTTYRAIAEEVIDRCSAEGFIPDRGRSPTRDMSLYIASSEALTTLALPGASQLNEELLRELPGYSRQLGGGLTEAMVRFAARYEYARTVEDILARRSRLLFLDARQAALLAKDVAEILDSENQSDPKLLEFLSLAQRYQADPVGNKKSLGGGNFHAAIVN